MDKEILIYIVFIAIAIISRLLKSNKNRSKAPSAPPQQRETPSQRPGGAKSFEELLREFTGENTSTEPRSLETVETEYESYEHIPSDDEIRETYERSVNQAKKLKTLDEQVDLEDIRTKSKYFADDEMKEENSVASDILESLKDPDGARRAVILSEIINRKY